MWSSACICCERWHQHVGMISTDSDISRLWHCTRESVCPKGHGGTSLGLPYWLTLNQCQWFQALNHKVHVQWSNHCWLQLTVSTPKDADSLGRSLLEKEVPKLRLFNFLHRNMRNRQSPDTGHAAWYWEGRNCQMGLCHFCQNTSWYPRVQGDNNWFVDESSLAYVSQQSS